MNNNDPMTEVIIKANNEMGSPIITARFLISLQISQRFILHYDAYQIGKYTHYRTRNKYEYQNTSNPFFEVGVLPEKMPRIEQEANQEDDPKDDGKDGPDGVRNVVDGILDAPDLGVDGQGKQKEQQCCPNF